MSTQQNIIIEAQRKQMIFMCGTEKLWPLCVSQNKDKNGGVANIPFWECDFSNARFRISKFGWVGV